MLTYSTAVPKFWTSGEFFAGLIEGRSGLAPRSSAGGGGGVSSERRRGRPTREQENAMSVKQAVWQETADVSVPSAQAAVLGMGTLSAVSVADELL